MIYIIFLFCTVCLTVLYQKLNGGQTLILARNRRVSIDRLLIGAIIVLAVSAFCGLRGMSVGADTEDIYYNVYYVKYCLQNSAYQGTEYGFYLLLKAGYLIFGSYSGVLFLTALLTAIFSFTGLAYYGDRVSLPLSMFLYLVFIYFVSFNIMRQILAVSVVIFALRYLDRGSYVGFALGVALAGFIHNSAAVAFVLIPVRLCVDRERLIKPLIVFILFLPFLVPVAMKVTEYIPFLARYAERYAVSFDFSIENLSLVIYFLPAFAIILYNYRRLIALDRRNIFFLIAALLVFEFALFKFYMVWLSRLMHFFTVSVCILLPQCVTVCRGTAAKRVMKAAIILYGVSYFVLFYIVLRNSGIFPYESIISL